jgi:hypothetical protein
MRQSATHVAGITAVNIRHIDDLVSRIFDQKSRLRVLRSRRVGHVGESWGQEVTSEELE